MFRRRPAEYLGPRSAADVVGVRAVEKAFVAGATGYTGRQVVKVLRERGIETVAHVRPGSRALEATRPVFEALGATIDTTPWDREPLVASLQRIQPTLVFALLGTTRKRAKQEAGIGAREAYEKIDYGLTALLLEAVREAGVHPRFVYLSSLGVSETSSNPYLAVRGRFERELGESGVPFTIVRPSFITGDREEPRPGEKLAASITDAALSALGALGASRFSARYRSVDARTLAEALVSASLDPSKAGATLSMDDFRA